MFSIHANIVGHFTTSDRSVCMHAKEKNTTKTSEYYLNELVLKDNYMHVTSSDDAFINSLACTYTSCAIIHVHATR